MPSRNALVKTAVHVVRYAVRGTLCVLLGSSRALRWRCASILVHDLAVGGDRHFSRLVQ